MFRSVFQQLDRASARGAPTILTYTPSCLVPNHWTIMSLQKSMGFLGYVSRSQVHDSCLRF